MSNNIPYKQGPLKATIGRFTYGAENILAHFPGGAEIKIGQFCSIARNINIVLGGNHRVDWITTYPFGTIFKEDLGDFDLEGHPSTKGNVEIGNDVWIGIGSKIMSGVKIGDGAVIAAFSNVIKNVEPYEIVGGNPAQNIKFRFNEDIIKLLLKLKWWDLSLEKIKEIQKVLCSEPTIGILNNLIQKYVEKEITHA